MVDKHILQEIDAVDFFFIIFLVPNGERKCRHDNGSRERNDSSSVQLGSMFTKHVT